MNAKVGIEESKPGVADDEADEEDRDPERAGEGENDACEQDQRGDERLQQDRQDDRHHQQRQRHDQLQVPLVRLVEVVVDRAAAADEGRDPRCQVRHGVAHLRHEVERETCCGSPFRITSTTLICPSFETWRVGSTAATPSHRPQLR